MPVTKLKSRTIYLDSYAESYLLYKVKMGFKVSSYIRYLISEARKREQDDKNDA
jgi:hypothetical protein